MPPKKNESFKIELKCFLGEPDLPRELLGIIKSGLGMPNVSGANQPGVFRCLLDWWRVFHQKAWQPLCEWNDHFVGDTTQSWKKKTRPEMRTLSKSNFSAHIYTYEGSFRTRGWGRGEKRNNRRKIISWFDIKHIWKLQKHIVRDSCAFQPPRPSHQ